MKKVIIAVQNTLVSEVMSNALKTHGMFVERVPSGKPQSVAAVCFALFADVLIMDVTRFGEGSFDNRTETVSAVRENNPEIKVCLVCDNVSDSETSYKVANAKATGVIDAFFYQSVPSDYIADVIKTL